jgi:hypothetical protein
MDQVYAKDVHKNFGRFYAAWPPTDLMRVGDYGTLDSNGLFHYIGNVTDKFQLPIEPVPVSQNARDHYEYSSKNAVNVKFNTRVEATAVNPAVKASLDLTFSRENAVHLNLDGCQIQRVNDMTELQDELARLKEEDKWHLHWVIVTEVVHSASALIVISAGSKSELKIEAEAAATINLAKLNIGTDLSIAHESQVGLKVITGVTRDRDSPIQPLFALHQLKRKLLSGDMVLNPKIMMDREDKDNSVLIKETYELEDLAEEPEQEDETA